MTRHPFSQYRTAQTLLWFGLLTVALQLAPVEPRWKVLPAFSDTFLARGLQVPSSGARSPVGGSPDQLPPPPAVDSEEGDPFYDRVGQPTPLVPSAAVAPPSSPSGAVLNPGAAPASWVASGLPEAQPSLAWATPSKLQPAPMPPASSRDAELLGKSARKGSLIGPLEQPWPIEQGCLEPLSQPCSRLALAPFFDDLRRTAQKEPGAITRVLHFGDSIIASDYISATVRRRLQREYGDSGHGFVLAARAWRWYDHRGVSLSSSSDWKPQSVLASRLKDRLLGLGGVSFISAAEGSEVTIGTAVEGKMGRAASRVELQYLAQPGGGALQVQLNGVEQPTLSTQADLLAARVERWTLPDGPAQLKLRTLGDGPVRLFGVVLERDVPGVVYDSLGIVGGSISSLKKIQRAHWLEALRQRQPSLLIFHYGANESLTYNDASPRVMREYERNLSTFLSMLRASLPDTSLLVMGPLDAAQREGEHLVSRPSISRMRDAQRRAALASGAAFWDTCEVMGGEGAMPRWVRAKLGSSDMVHPSWQGAVFLGNELARSLITTYAAADHGSPHPVLPDELGPRARRFEGMARVKLAEAPGSPAEHLSATPLPAEGGP